MALRINLTKTILNLCILTTCAGCISSGIKSPSIKQSNIAYTPSLITSGKTSDIRIDGLTTSGFDTIAMVPGGPFLSAQTTVPSNITKLVAADNFIYATTQNNELIVLKLENSQLEVIARRNYSAPINDIAVTNDAAYIAIDDNTLHKLSTRGLFNSKLDHRYRFNKNISKIAVSEHTILLLFDNLALGTLTLNSLSTNARQTVVNQILLANPVNAIALSGQFAYICDSKKGIMAVDFQTHTQPHIISPSSGNQTALDIVINGTLAFVANGSGGMSVYDISDPSELRWLGSNNKLGPVYSVAAYSNGIVVNNDLYRLATLKVSNPELPIINSLYKPRISIAKLATSGNIAFISSANRLMAIDLTVDATQQISNEGINLGGSRRAFIRNQIAYVADWFSGLHLYDISIPQNPRHLGNFHTPGSSKGVVVDGHYAYVGDDDHGLQIIDIRDPRNPQWISAVQTTGLAYTLTKLNNLIYLADHRGGFHIVDVANVYQPQVVGSYNTPGKSWAITVENEIAYVADDLSGLLIFDISNPAAPKKIAQYNIGAYAEDVAVVEGIAYVSFFDKGLYLVDVSRPSQPKTLNHIPIPGNARSVSVVDNYAYVAGWESGIHIIDISNADNARIVGSYDTAGSAWGVDVNGGFAYVWDWWGGIKVVNVNNPERPELVGAYQSQGKIHNLAIKDNYLFTANGTRGLQVFDIKNPLNPIWTTGLDLAGSALDIFIEKDTAYIAAGDAGVVAANIANPFAVQWLGSLATSGTATIVRAKDNILFVADDSGLNIIDTHQAEHLRLLSRHPLISNDIWLEENNILIVGNDFGLKIYNLGLDANLQQTHHWHLRGNAKIVRANGDRIFVYEAGVGIHILQKNGNRLNKLALINISDTITDMRSGYNKLYVSVQNLGLQTYDIQTPEAPFLTTMYPATEHLESFVVNKNAVFFAGKNTITSLNLLPDVKLSDLGNDQLNLRVPSTLPLGSYHLLLQSTHGDKYLPNALTVQLPKRKKPKFTMEDFKKILKQKQQAKP